MEAFILFLILILFLHFYSKDFRSKELKRWAEKTCSYMTYGEVLLQIARIRSDLNSYGFLSDKDRTLLRFLEERERVLKSSATPESVVKDIEAYAFMINPEAAWKSAVQAGNNDEVRESHLEQKPRYRLTGGKWQQVGEE